MEVILIRDCGAEVESIAIAKTYSDAIDFLLKEYGLDNYWVWVKNGKGGHWENPPLTPDIIKEMYAWGIKEFNEVYYGTFQLIPYKLYEKE